MPEQSSEWQAEFQNLRDSATRLAQLRPDVPEEAAAVIRNIDDPEQLTDFLAPNLDIPVAQKQAILEELDVRNGCALCKLTSQRNSRWPRSNKNCRRM